MANLVNPNNKDKKEFSPNVDNTTMNAQVSTGAKIIWYILFIFIIPMFIHLSNVNKLKKANISINQMTSGIDIQLQKRSDTLRKLVSVTKSSMKYEKELLTDVTKMRSNSFKGSDGNSKLDGISARIMATAENYPKLESLKGATDLMEQATYIEREISASRRLYNAEVSLFNQMLVSWPSNVSALSLKFETMEMFKASEETKKDVDVSLDF